MERYVIEIVSVKGTRDVPLARHGPQDSSVSLPLTNTYGSSYVLLLGRSYWYIQGYSSVLGPSDDCVDKRGVGVEVPVIFWKVLSEHRNRDLLLTESLYCTRRQHRLHDRNSKLDWGYVECSPV